MKKLIYIMGVSLILTGCSSTYVGVQDSSKIISTEEVDSMEYNREKGIYINDNMKDIISDINNLTEKYKNVMEEREFQPLYINIYEDDYNLGIRNTEFDNRNAFSSEYFNDLVEILDNSLAEGLKDYIVDMKNIKLQPNETIIKKIGKTVVYVRDESEYEDRDNYISIKINFLDVKNEYYRDVFNRISDDKYILTNVIIGEKLNLIDFVNYNNGHNLYDHNSLNIRYNMFFKDKNIEKVNILAQGKNETDLEYDDIGIFINLINSLDLNKQEDKDRLINEYKNIFKEKTNSQKISLDNYNVYIDYGKGNTYTGNDRKLIYFSIEKSKNVQ